MRDQLEQIERVEQYLNNELDAAARTSFERELSSDESLRNLLQHMEDLKAAAFRNGLRKTIEQNAPGSGGWGKGTLFTGLILVLGFAAWMLWPSASTDVAESTQPIESEQQTPLMPESQESIYDTVEKPKVPQAATSPSKPAVQVERKVRTSNPSPKKPSLGGHETWVEPDVQLFDFEASEGATIEGKNGMLVIVPSNAFIDSLQQPVSGNVRLSLVEAFTVEEMVLYKLQTLSNGQTLESGGMFYLDATANGASVQVNPKRPLYIEIPTTERKEGMMAFEGKVDAQGSINWVDPKPLKKFLVKVPFEQLDFLPPGFANAVAGKMPFLGHEETSDQLTDSLYYSLSNKSEGDNYSSFERPEMTQTLPTEGGNFRPGSTVDGSSMSEDTADYATNIPRCGIQPSTIETIRSEKFENTFIATNEFAERIQQMHGQEAGNDMVELYLKNLTRDLCYADSLVARLATNDTRLVFEKLAKEKLTNVKDAPLYQDRLSAYYSKKLREVKAERQKLQNELSRKNSKELDQLAAKARKSENTIRLQLLPRLNVASNPVYSTVWASMGWGNIDKYYKMLLNGTKEVNIQVSNPADSMEVTQWLGAINTYTDLLKTTEGYRAIFPRRNTGNANTHAFAMAETSDGYAWAMQHYNPYQVSSVQLQMAVQPIEAIRNDLRTVSLTFGKLQAQLAKKREWQQQAIAWQREAQKKQAKWLEKRKELWQKYTDEVARQREVQAVMNDLRRVAFVGCTDNDVEEIQIDEPRRRRSERRLRQ